MVTAASWSSFADPSAESHAPLGPQIRVFGAANVGKFIETAVRHVVKDIYHPTLLSAYEAEHERIDEYSLSRGEPWVFQIVLRKIPGKC